LGLRLRGFLIASVIHGSFIKHDMTSHTKFGIGSRALTCSLSIFELNKFSSLCLCASVFRMRLT
jgi:hypothetical protein